jgi:uncharacterized protein (DUF58 family)
VDAGPERAVLVGFSGLCLFLGVRLEAPALVALGVAILLLIAFAYVSARGRLRALRLRRETEGRAFEDDEVLVRLILENHGQRPALLLELHDSFGPALADRQVLLHPGPLPPARRVHLSYRAICTRLWGVHTVGPLAVRAADPLGLFAPLRLLPDAVPFDLFPRVHPVAGLEELGARPSFSPSDLTAARGGESALYLGVRDHRPGDELRRVHWPATARRGLLMSKQFEQDLTPYFTLFLDLDRRHRAGTGRKSTLEYVVRTAASLLATASRRGDVVQAFGERRASLFVPPGRGESHLARALDEVIRVKQDGTVPLLDVVDLHQAGVPRGSTAALLSATLFLDAGPLAEALEWMRSRSVLALVVAIDGDSFLPIDKRARPRDEVLAQREELHAIVRGRGGRLSILDGERSLPDELRRPGWVEAS